MRAEKNKRRMGGADWLLLLITMLAAVGLVLRGRDLRQGIQAETKECAVWVTWENVYAETLACLRAGEQLCTAAGEPFGQILEITSEAAETEVIAGGTVFRVASTERRRAEILLSVPLRPSGDLLLRESGEPLAVGQRLQLYARLAEVTVTVSHFEKNSLF